MHQILRSNRLSPWRYFGRTGIVLLSMLLAAPFAAAEQYQRLGAWDVHYVVIRSSFLKPEIAANNGIIRGPDRAVLNLSILDQGGRPSVAKVTGRFRNLLGLDTELEFDEVREGEAVYYLAQFRHTDREILRFSIDLTPPDGTNQRLEFQQQLFEDGR